MHDRTGAAFLAALQNLNELSERLAVGRDDDDYLRRLANAAQDTAIAAREAYAETREKYFLCSRKYFSRADVGTDMTADQPEQTGDDLPDGYNWPYRKTAR